MRYLMAVVLMGLLAACNAGASSPSVEPLPSIGQPMESMAPSTDSSESAAASESAGANESQAMAASCESAWTGIDAPTVQSINDLDALAGEIDQTFQQCDTVDDWVAAAQDALPMLDSTVLRGWAAARCSANATLDQTAVCDELNS
jgi:hypothetical protein